MNHPATNRRALAELANYATQWREIPSAMEAGQLGLKMEAALQMTLLFKDYTTYWTDQHREQWIELQRKAGIDEPNPEATSRVLCDTIRAVLGVE